MAATDWDLQPGDVLKRTELHDRFGGGRQDGIAPSRTTPNILIFTDPASGHIHGYDDRWEGPLLLYVGRGQRGDQQLKGANKAVLEHRKTGRAIRVFKGAGGNVQYVGEFVLDENAPYIFDQAPETGGGPLRKVVRFRLRPARVASQSPPQKRESSTLSMLQHQVQFVSNPLASAAALRQHLH